MARISRATRSQMMAAIRSKDTNPEMIVRRLVHQMGYRYRLHARSLPGQPDLVFKSQKKIIFVHGCFWHMHAGCSSSHMPKTRKNYWKPKLLKNRARDKRSIKTLEKLKWKVLVIWECEAEKNIQMTEKQVLRFLSK